MASSPAAVAATRLSGELPAAITRPVRPSATIPERSAVARAARHQLAARLRARGLQAVANQIGSRAASGPYCTPDCPPGVGAAMSYRPERTAQSGGSRRPSATADLVSGATGAAYVRVTNPNAFAVSITTVY